MPATSIPNHTPVFVCATLQGAEPWYIGHRALLPLYDERFVGYGFNKQMQVNYAVANCGMRLRVLTDAWLVHLPHAPTLVSVAFNKGGRIGIGGRKRRQHTQQGQQAQGAPSHNAHRLLLASEELVSDQPSLASIGSRLSNQTTGGQGKALEPQQKLQVRYAYEFHAHMRRTGIKLRYAPGALLPESYAPTVDAPLLQLLAASPWWSDYRAK